MLHLKQVIAQRRMIAVMVSVANFHDSKAALLFMRTLQYLLIPITVILADGGYRGNIIEEIKDKFGYIIQVVLRSDHKEKVFKPIHKRWIIERTFSWFDNDSGYRSKKLTSKFRFVHCLDS
ncbi:transposase [Chryseobacterium sp. RP-3-3]|uniref:Transposase n=1 Tax=Chryseobacterium antibioticum TaxID=2728847 RepID=A0A7Y0AKJ1_9FLAO|nr:transposase [Chryseobacterium antibioticum]NML69051.1 transposase [Chryseobacterium antibioticum]